MMNNVERLKIAYPPMVPIMRAPQVSIHDLYTHPPEAQRFLIEGILPGGVVTLLGAHGGAGKSILALMATACLVTGRPFMGKATEKCRVVFFSGEDPAPVVRRRLSHICRYMEIAPDELSQGLLMLDATDSPTLYNGAGTPSLAALRLDVNDFNPGAIIIDNASDTYDANEIERARVREFIRLLVSLGKGNNAAVLLLAHIDKQAARAGVSSEGYSGSTAWHNSARSRLFLSTKDDVLILEHQKSNLGPRSEPIYLRWTDGGLLAQADVHDNTVNNETVLRLIAEAYSRGEYISPAPTAANNVHKVLQLSLEYPKGLSRQGLTAVIRELEAGGIIVREDYINEHRNKRQRYAVSAVGCVK
jgi:RecA-family ATPase